MLHPEPDMYSVGRFTATFVRRLGRTPRLGRGCFNPRLESRRGFVFCAWILTSLFQVVHLEMRAEDYALIAFFWATQEATSSRTSASKTSRL
jgi:hypothetical protein